MHQKETNIKCKNVSSNKEFCTNGIGLGVQAWIDFFYEEHLINQAFKLRLALAKNAKLAFFGVT